MTDTWEMGYEIACIAHGELDATIQTLEKHDATIEEVSYVLYNDVDLIKAVLADPNWAGRLMKAPPPQQAQFGLANVEGQTPVMSTPQGTFSGPDLSQQKTGWAALNPLIDQPSEAHRRAMTNWIGADKMREQGLQPKEGLMNRFGNMMEARRDRQAQLRQVPGWFETALGRGKEGLRERAQVRDAIRGNQTKAGLEARERGAEIDPETGQYDESFGRPAEEEPAEEESDLGPSVAAIPDGAPPPGDVAAPVESPATEDPWWAGGRKRGGLPSSGEGMGGMGAKRAGNLEGYGGPTEGESIEGWASRTGANPGDVRALQAHMEGGKRFGGSKLFEGLGGQKGWEHPFGASVQEEEGTPTPTSTPTLPSEEEVASAIKPEGEVAEESPLVAGQGDEGGDWSADDWLEGFEGKTPVDEGAEPPKKKVPVTTNNDFQFSDDDDGAMSMAWNHLSLLKQNWDYATRQYE